MTKKALSGELREKLAAIEHERWADWQKWVHAQMRPVIHGHLLSHDQYQAWQRQIRTPYAELSDKEKAEDMKQVDRYWPLIEEYILQHDLELKETVMGAVPEKLRDPNNELFTKAYKNGWNNHETQTLQALKTIFKEVE